MPVPELPAARSAITEAECYMKRGGCLPSMRRKPLVSDAQSVLHLGVLAERLGQSPRSKRGPALAKVVGVMLDAIRNRIDF